MSAKKAYKEYYDREEDIMWMVFKGGPVDYVEEVRPDLIVEYDENGNAIGFEIFNYLKNLLEKIKPVSNPQNTGLRSYVLKMRSGDVFNKYKINFVSANSQLAYG